MFLHLIGQYYGRYVKAKGMCNDQPFDMIQNRGKLINLENSALRCNKN